jgi:hypothetical protein
MAKKKCAKQCQHYIPCIVHHESACTPGDGENTKTPCPCRPMWPMCMLILEYLKNYVETKRQSNARHCPPHQDSTCVKFMQQWKSQCRSNHPRRWQYGTEEHWIHHRGRCAGAIKWTPGAPVDEKPWGLEVTISGFFFWRTITSKHPERTKMGKFMAKIKRSGVDVSVLFISLTFQSWESLHLWPRLIWPAH